jgi:Zn-dependent peptidase ImmA (M78 family)
MRICNVLVPIVRATSEQMPELTNEGEDDGFFCPSRTLIVIRAGQSETQERDTIAHEIGHAFLYLSGLQHLLKAITNWPKGYDDLEECLVRIAAPHLGVLS